MPLNPEELALVLKTRVESPNAVTEQDFSETLIEADTDILRQVVMALGSNFTEANSDEGRARLEATLRTLPEVELTALLELYVQTSAGFLTYYRNVQQYDDAQHTEELQVEAEFDQVARSFEKTLARTDHYTLVMVVAALSGNFGDVSTSDGQMRLRDTMRYFVEDVPSDDLEMDAAPQT